MPYGNYQSVPFWDFIRSMDGAERSGAGVDQPAFAFQHFGPPPAFVPHAFGFGGPSHCGPPGFTGRGGWGRGRGPPGRHCHRRDGSHERRSPGDNPEAPSNDDEKSGEPDETPRDENEGPQPGPHGPHRGGPHHRGHRHGPWGRRGPAPPQFGGPDAPPFDLSALFGALSSHPIAQALRTYAEQNGVGAEQTEDENTFTPPIDVFSTPATYVLHISLPGAKKEDVGVNWDAEKGELNVAGVVYRQGDEDFLKTLSKKERKVGVFERAVKLPTGDEEKEEVDGDAITAKLEDGVLIVTVPKVEKEWTEVKKVDIE